MTHPSATEEWARGDMRNETLINNEAKARREPYALWPRKAKAIYISEVAALQNEDLRSLGDDMQVQLAELNDAITAEYALLNSIPADEPASIAAKKLAIKKMCTKKSGIRLIMLEAVRQRKARNREANKPNPKRVRIVATQQEHDDLESLNNKMQHFKRKELLSAIRAEIGSSRFCQLENLASLRAISLLEEWATSSGIQPKLVQHVVNHVVNNALTSLPRNL
jgi:hypothetical protein